MELFTGLRQVQRNRGFLEHISVPVLSTGTGECNAMSRRKTDKTSNSLGRILLWCTV
jgi:hypothetical protein